MVEQLRGFGVSQAQVGIPALGLRELCDQRPPHLLEPPLSESVRKALGVVSAAGVTPSTVSRAFSLCCYTDVLFCLSLSVWHPSHCRGHGGSGTRSQHAFPVRRPEQESPFCADACGHHR